jgi:hypothetical protein
MATNIGVFGNTAVFTDGRDLTTHAICPNNTYISEIDIDTNNITTGRFTAKCSDGTKLKDMGAGGSNVLNGYSFKTYRQPLGWNGIYGYSRAKDLSLFDSGSPTGTRVDLTCPENQKLSGYEGWANEWVDGVRFFCSPITVAPKPPTIEEPKKDNTMLNMFMFLIFIVSVAFLVIWVKNKITHSNNIKLDGHLTS